MGDAIDPRRITRGEAARLRALRSRVHRAVAEVEELRLAVVQICPHARDVRADCPVCALWDQLSNASIALRGAPEALDRMLQAGPSPTTRE